MIIAISRTGRSIEIVHLLAKARECGAIVAGVTNSADGLLGREAQIPSVVPTKFDHAISVNTYSTLALATGTLASAAVSCFDDSLAAGLARTIAETDRAKTRWQEQIAKVAFPGCRLLLSRSRFEFGQLP